MERKYSEKQRQFENLTRKIAASPRPPQQLSSMEQNTPSKKGQSMPLSSIVADMKYEREQYDFQRGISLRAQVQF